MRGMPSTSQEEICLSSAALFYPPIDKHPGTLVDGCSAISISKDWILTHGSALELPTNNYDLRKYILDMKLGELTIIPHGLVNNLKFRIYRNKAIIKESQTNDKTLVHCTGTLAAAWRCPLLKNSFDVILNNWYFPNSSDYKNFLRSVFLLIHVDSSVLLPHIEKMSAKEALHQLFCHTVKKFNRGSTVEIVSTPFGNPMLMHSISRGVISNIIGDQNCMIMTDAITYPKCEGGPLYSVLLARKYQIMGMVIASVSYCRGEIVDFTFAANLAPCLRNILWKEVLYHPLIPDYVYEDINETLYKSVVEVRCGISFATGILVDKDTGTFLTCSHVVKEAPEREIQIKMDGRISRISAKLIYRTLNQLYDVAVLRVDPKKINPSLRSIQLSSAPIVKGEPVVCVGFQIYSSLRPTISSGVVSTLMDCMLLTTCCTQGGSSGGPIISTKTGKMLGMVVCNAKSSDNTMFYSRLTMSVPATVLSEPLRQYLLTDDPDVLKAFACDDPEVKKIWNLYSFLPSRL